jgi:hypothetical protein
MIAIRDRTTRLVCCSCIARRLSGTHYAAIGTHSAGALEARPANDDEVEHVTGRAAEPVELHDDELVSGADELEDRGELVAAVTALAADLLSADDLTAGGPKARFLGGVVLVAGGDADWKQVEADGCRFTKEGWPRQAAALGWSEENAVGLIWTLQGRRVIAMTTRRAAIISASGEVTFYPRMTP